MRIVSVELWHVCMPLKSPWKTAYGSDDAQESVIIKMTNSEGVYAYGEAAPFAAPTYSPEWAGGVFSLIRDWLAPRLLGEEIDDGYKLQELLSIFKGNPFAKAGLDVCFWNLHAKMEGKPLHILLGATRDTCACGTDFGVLDSLDALVARIGDAIEKGFPRIKLKMMPGWDTNMLDAVRDAFPHHVFHVDTNCGYALDDHIWSVIDKYKLAMVEQPLAYDDLNDHATLQQRITTSVCLDESVKSLANAQQAIAMGACRYINIKPGRVGGVTVAKQIHDYAASKGVPCWVGGMLSSSIGAHSDIALAMLPNMSYPADIFPSTKFYDQDLGRTPVELINVEGVGPSAVASASAPEPDDTLLTQLTKQHALVALAPDGKRMSTS